MSGVPTEKKHTRLQQQMMQFVEEQNRARVVKLQKVRRNNVITGSLLGAAAFSIYVYSLTAIKQETFLDDFIPPEKVVD
ncbi:coiled-coil domain containing 56 [Arctopsyche grandis]|uniref:coiled-coil domain containing 56 n=1 Tax=Arctopsyche grandis TaxID=121162 RepID=UPI00406D8076